MQLVLIVSTLASLLAASPIDSSNEAPQLNRRLYGGPGYGFSGGHYYGPGYGSGGPVPYSSPTEVYRTRPLASVNLRDLSVGSPKQKDTQINIDEGMYNSQGYNPLALAPWGNGPAPGPFPGQAPPPQ